MDNFDIVAISITGGFVGAWLFYNKGRFTHALRCLKYDPKSVPCIFGLHKWEVDIVRIEGQEFTPQGVPVGAEFNKTGKIRRCKICPAVDTRSLKIDKGLSVVKDKK